jgi:hypothetical protein
MKQEKRGKKKQKYARAMKDEKNPRRILQVVEGGEKNTVQNNQKQQQQQQRQP